MTDQKTLLDNLFGGIQLLRPGTTHYALNRAMPDPAQQRGLTGFGEDAFPPDANREAKAAKPEEAQSQAAQPGTAQPGTAQADTAQADTAQADTAQADAAQADAAQADAAQPGTAQPQAAQPETAQPQAQPGKAQVDPAKPGAAKSGAVQSGQGTGSEPARVLLISDQALSEDEIRQTDKIMLACGLELNARTVVTAEDFRQGDFPAFQVAYFFLFGTGPSELGFNFELPVNRMISLNDAWWVKTVAVKTLIKSPETKTDLWKNGLQPHFQGR